MTNSEIMTTSEIRAAEADISEEYDGFNEFCDELDRDAAMVADHEAMNPDGCHSDALDHSIAHML
jgi:hypothetical protein